MTLNGATPPPPQVAVAPGQPRPPSMPTPQRPRFLTDSDGRFAFRYLVRGVYQLSASKPGYADGGYGRTRPNGNTRSLQLRDHERIGDVTVRVFKNGSISGTVRDEAGDPVVGLPVRIYRRALIAGRRMLQPANTSGDLSTDDRGVYRIRDLVPGDYVVSVPLIRTSMPADFGMNGRVATAFEQTAYTPGSGGVNYGSGGTAVGADTRFVLSRTNGGAESLNPTTTGGKLLGYATQYFPSSTTVARADSVTVASGEDRSGVDFVLRPQPMVSISGQLFVPTGDAANYALHLVPTDTGEMSIDPDMASAVTDSTGAFVFLAVPAGQYVIQTVKVPRQGRAPPPPPPPPQLPGGATSPISTAPGRSMTVTTVNGQIVTTTSAPSAALEPLLWTATPISVGETDLHGVALTMHEGMKISGRVEFDGTAERPPAQQLARIPVSVETADGRQRANYYPQPGRIEPDGKFSTQGFLPGKYFLRIGGSPAGWTLKSAMLNGVDVSDTPFELADKDIANIVVTFTDRISQLSGTVRQITSAGDVQDTAVIVFPADVQGWTNFGFNSRRMRSARPSQNGSFSLGTLPAGDYYAIAIPDERSAEWQDPKFLETLTRSATRFMLTEGEKRTIDLQVQDVRIPGQLAWGRILNCSICDKWAVTNAAIQDATPSPGGPFVPDDDPQVRDPGVLQPTGSGSITGRVVADDGSNQAVRKVRVSARGVETRVERVAFTDAEGRFSLATLPAGRYYVSASKPAYLSLTYGQRRPGRGLGTPVVLADAKSAIDLQLRLPKGSVITGTVFDHYGAPLPNVRVQPMQWIMRDGERMLNSVGVSGGGTTDDRGVYRLYGMQPGSYLIVVTPPNPGTGNAETRMLSDEEMRQAIMDLQAPRPQSLIESPLASPIRNSGSETTQTITIPPPPPGPWPEAPQSGRGVGFSKIYYPGTPIDTEGVIVTVAQGQELPGIDVTLRLVPTSRIDGRVLAPDGSVTQRATVTLMSVSANSTTSTSVQFRPDGTFQGANIAPGKYTLAARLQVPMAPPPDAPPGFTSFTTGTQFGWQDIVVNGEDLTGITIATTEGQTISGRIAFAGKATPPEWKNVRVNVEPMGLNRNLTPAPRAPQVEADGTFVMKGVMPGRYRLSAGLTIQTPPVANPSGVFVPVAPTWTVRTSAIGGRDTYETPFDVQAGQDYQNAVITFTDQVTELSGTILDGKNAPVGGLTILLFPTDRTQWATSSSRRMRQTGSPDGKFRWYGLLPGEYFLAVVTELEPGDWGDPAYMEALSAASLKITLTEGEKKVQDLRAGG